MLQTSTDYSPLFFCSKNIVPYFLRFFHIVLRLFQYFFAFVPYFLAFVPYFFCVCYVCFCVCYVCFCVRSVLFNVRSVDACYQVSRCVLWNAQILRSSFQGLPESHPKVIRELPTLARQLGDGQRFPWPRAHVRRMAGGKFRRLTKVRHGEAACERCAEKLHEVHGGVACARDSFSGHAASMNIWTPV